MASRTLAKTGPQVDDFIGGIVELGDRLGPLVWQFEAGRKLDADDFALFLGLLPKQTAGIRLRHVIDVRDPTFVDADYLALLRQHRIATVFTDSHDYPSFADITADFVYARLMRSQAQVATGYDDSALVQWAKRARLWAAGLEPGDLPRIFPDPAPAVNHRDVFVYFISAAKLRNPAAAQSLLRKLSALD